MSTRSPRSSIEAGRVGPWVLAAVILALPAPARAADPPAALRDRARAVLADPRYQRELPAGRDERPAEEGGWMSGSPAPVLAASLQPPFLAQVVLAVLAAVALLLLALRAAQAWRERRLPPAGPGPGGEPARRPAGESPPGDADRLAAEGRFAEAVHALLLATCRQLAERFRVPLSPERTSRELLRLLPLERELGAALADLVQTVERSLFGGAPVRPDDYQRSLGHARRLLREGRAA